MGLTVTVQCNVAEYLPGTCMQNIQYVQNKRLSVAMQKTVYIIQDACVYNKGPHVSHNQDEAS